MVDITNFFQTPVKVRGLPLASRLYSMRFINQCVTGGGHPVDTVHLSHILANLLMVGIVLRNLII